MKLPPNMNEPEVQATVARFKEEVASHVLTIVLEAGRQTGEMRGAGAVAMVAVLDFALEQVAVWHRSQDLPFDEERFFGFVRERLTIAEANAAAYMARHASRRGLQ